MKTIYIAAIKNWTLATLFVVFAGGSVLTATLPQAVSAADPVTVADCSKGILTFPTWFRGIVKIESVDGKNVCVIMSPADLSRPGQNDGLSNFIWHIVLNALDIALQLAGYIAVGFILYGGFLFMTSQGSAEGSTKARKTILNAVIGLVISIGSVAIVNLIVGITK
jgi:hypothetical protein